MSVSEWIGLCFNIHENPSGLRAISFINNRLQPLGPIGKHFRLRAESPIRSSNIDVISLLSIK